MYFQFSLPPFPLFPVPEIIDPVFAKTSQNAGFLLSENERFGLVFVKTGSINSGTGNIHSNVARWHILYSISANWRNCGYNTTTVLYCALPLTNEYTVWLSTYLPVSSINIVCTVLNCTWPLADWLPTYSFSYMTKLLASRYH